MEWSLVSKSSWPGSLLFAPSEVTGMVWAIFDGPLDNNESNATSEKGRNRMIFMRDSILRFSTFVFLKSARSSKVSNEVADGGSTSTTWFVPTVSSGFSSYTCDAVAPVLLRATSFSLFLLDFLWDFPVLVMWRTSRRYQDASSAIKAANCSTPENFEHIFLM